MLQKKKSIFSKIREESRSYLQNGTTLFWRGNSEYHKMCRWTRNFMKEWKVSQKTKDSAVQRIVYEQRNGEISCDQKTEHE